jgi:hypothetical protein
MLQVKQTATRILTLLSSDTIQQEITELETLPAWDQLHRLALLILDLKGQKQNTNVKDAILQLRKVLRDKQGLISTLTSAEVVRLIAPVEEEFSILFSSGSGSSSSSLAIAPILSDLWNPLMAQATDTDAVNIFDILLIHKRHDRILAEIDRRLAEQKGKKRNPSAPDSATNLPLLLFYQAAVSHLAGRTYGTAGFIQAIKQAGAGQERVLRAAAVRLAEHAEGPLKIALQRFDFEILEQLLRGFPSSMPFPFPGGPGSEEILEALEEILEKNKGELPGGFPSMNQILEDLKDEFDFDIKELTEEIDEEFLNILNELEKNIDNSGLRGAPEGTLQAFGNQIRSDRKARRMLNWVRDACPSYLLDAISREARVILFPERKNR